MPIIPYPQNEVGLLVFKPFRLHIDDLQTDPRGVLPPVASFGTF